MSDFTLEISGEGEVITLEPVGVIDLAAATMMLEALSVLRRQAIAFLQVRLDRVTRFTDDALTALRRQGLAPALASASARR